MREAVVVSYARTGLAKSGRGGFNMTPTVSMAAHAVKHAVKKSGLDGSDIEDVFMGNVAHGGGNLARQAGLLAGLPVTASGVTVNRFCSSGLQRSAACVGRARRGERPASRSCPPCRSAARRAHGPGRRTGEPACRRASGRRA